MIIDRLMRFLQLQARWEDFIGGNGGFANFLGLSTTTTSSSSRPTVLRTPDADDDGSSVNASSSNHSYGGIRANQFSFIDSEKPYLGESRIPSMVFRYELPVKRLGNVMTKKNDDLKSGNSFLDDSNNNDEEHHCIHLSTLTSILDEVTTLGMIAATLPSGYPRPGVSVTMATQWGPGGMTSLGWNKNKNGRTIDIVTTITKKGQNLGFIRAEVKDPISGDVICYFQHTKYLPVGWLMGIVLSPLGRWGLSSCSEYLFPLGKMIQSIAALSNGRSTTTISTAADDDILHSFQLTGPSTAMFEVGPQHTNGFGGLHGGVQAMLMELLGREVSKRTFLAHSSSHMALSSSSSSFDGSPTSHSNNNNNNISIFCDRLQISYQSSASKFVELQAFVMMTDEQHDQQQQLDRSVITIRIVIVRAGNLGKDGTERVPSSSSSLSLPGTTKPVVIVSEGILSFVVSTRQRPTRLY